MAAITPGEWDVRCLDEDLGDYRIASLRERYRALRDSDPEWQDSEECEAFIVEDEANRAAIAALPALLEAAERVADGATILDSAGIAYADFAAMRALLAAISRAKGGTDAIRPD